MRGDAIPNFSRSSRSTISSVSRRPTRVTARGTSFNGRCVVASATRSGASRAPPTSSITTRGVCVRSARYSVWPENGMPASIITLFCTGAVTSASNAPVAQVSVACASIVSTLCAFVGSSWPGVTGAASG